MMPLQQQQPPTTTTPPPEAKAAAAAADSDYLSESTPSPWSEIILAGGGGVRAKVRSLGFLEHFIQFAAPEGVAFCRAL